ncbi:MAG: alpha/beta-type small acid-soluble spore protein [Limnochordaceae bacterium]|uniref:Alpha/beta-type small acid-soluble spore protein n=1 Tax=Carboxydichorda subterranea TaxID=3109565 RepID=A0ABZ1BUE8_9FIRM|nr:alpha/beta-type small acid-soluble spore protein [Limnochorda sp. L945t]MBE3597349.1 alpha/beta-type small acid-soluble spore protein [Limnochordaceae bacterium]WRP16399.1 alpha/beta-type small acid-soluble spore protein [Limnochorda sp. L945t]
MAAGQKRNRPLLTQALGALDKFKYEVASELNINPEYKSGYWGNISARECGAVGGNMVRRMIAAAEQTLAQQAAGSATAAFRAALPVEPDAQRGATSAHNPSEIRPGQSQQAFGIK